MVHKLVELRHHLGAEYWPPRTKRGCLLGYRFAITQKKSLSMSNPFFQYSIRRMLVAIFWVALSIWVWLVDLHAGEVTRRSISSEVAFIVMVYLRLLSPFAAAITLFGLKWGIKIGAFVLCVILFRYLIFGLLNG